MSYRLLTDGVIECDTADEARALFGGTFSNGRAPKRRKGGNTAMKQAWARARKLAKKEGISVADARAKLAKARKAK